MKTAPIDLKISTPSAPTPPGRGFYQLEDDALFVQIGLYNHRHRFFSYLESNDIHFDFDRAGRLIFIEVAKPRRQWPIVAPLNPPEIVEPADIRWLAFRQLLPDFSLMTNSSKDRLCLSFASSQTTLNYYLADNVILQATSDNKLAAIWVLNLIDDLAGREISAFRREIRLEEPYFA